ncbi:PHP domain protein [Ferrimonas balearica DSM 9799]|uniref:PHP domain protein n=1 Tax=Ferrimonas balearica (strain DSM 9799 / CCM 4581 / KCTC 23876 / PAT) TaxID=550540 RepID=E1SNR3_FERBD|nr:PHP domain-containing protein [Ferrimonas balearica]ADN76736.1 PHP domain protein [Ferrimonas balearica DSM 9799]MBY5979839.1 PHP domain-containing protein [Ferrimonas balearica]
MKIDLHCHTTASDGTLTPTELVTRAALQQVTILAITDHDTVAGLDQAADAAAQKGVRLISGVEISTRWHGFEIHIVGLNFDPQHPAMVALLDSQQRNREARAVAIGDKLAKRRIEGAYEAARAMAGEGVVGRGHFARVLVNRGIVRQPQAAFDKYLGKGQSAYVPTQWCSIEQAVAAIHQAGGVSVLAHPGKYSLSNKWLRKLLGEFQAAGGMAMEALGSQQSPDQRRFLLSLAEEHQMLISAGSDFHQPGRWIELGRGLQRPDMPGVWHHLGWV